MTWRSQIEAHYWSNWGVEGIVCPFNRGPIHELPSDFSVMLYPPHGRRTVWTYATYCMSQPDDTTPIELHMFSPYASDSITELLVVTAHFHRTGARLDLGHTVNFGRPWLGDSLCDRGFVSLPYLDGPSLEKLAIGPSTVKFYWLIPVTPSEVDYKKEHGVEALERRFEQAGFDYVNPGRPSVI